MFRNKYTLHYTSSKFNGALSIYSLGANSEQAKKKNRNGYEAGKTGREATHTSKKRKFNACYVNHDF